MPDDENITSNASGGGASLDGYLYQVDISNWAALDLLLEARAGALAANPEFEVRKGASRHANRFVSGPGLLVRRREGKA
jgi:hypothetical protein